MPTPKYQPGQTVTLRSGALHRILEVYEWKAARGYRYSTMTARPDGQLYGPFRNITDKTPVTRVEG